MDALIRIVILGAVFIVAFAFLSLVAAVPTYFLWNWLMPTLFGIAKVTYWQAWGLNFLAALLFKSSTSSSSK